MRIHILGICGTFMGGIALLARELGIEVDGSDQNVYPPMSTQLADSGIRLYEGYKPGHLDPVPDLVVIGNALSRGNPAVEYALDRGLDYMSGPEFLARHVQPNAAPDDAVPAPAEPAVPETAEQAVARLQQELATHPDTPELKLDLALAQMRAGNSAAAAAEFDTLPANLAADDRARRLRNQLDFAAALEHAPPADELAGRLQRDPGDHAARDLLGVRLLMQGDHIGALEQFLTLLKADRQWNDGQARKRLIAAFNVLDDADLVSTYRRKMAAVLF